MMSYRDLWGIWLVAGLLVAGAYWRWYQAEGRQVKPGTKQELQLRVWDKADEGGRYTALPFQAWRVRCYQETAGCEGWPALRAGDSVGVRGEWQPSQEKTSQAKYLRVERVVSLTKLQPNPTTIWWWVRQIQQIRDQVLSVYKSNLSEPYSGLLAGIVLGIKSNLTADFYQALADTGTVHIVAASGYNISIVTAALIGILVVFLSRRRALWVTLAGIGVYVIAAGASPPIIRAGIMGGLLVLAQLSGRLYQAVMGLGLSLVVMLLLWPWMLWSLSFVLSVSATAGVIWGGPVIRDKIKSLTKGRGNEVWMGELGTILAATLATLPVIMLYFNQVSLLSPIVNILVLGLVPPVMAIGGAVAGVSWLFPGLAGWVVYLAYPFLWLMVEIIESGAKLPLMRIEVAGVNGWIAVGWWVLLAVWWRPWPQHK